MHNIEAKAKTNNMVNMRYRILQLYWEYGFCLGGSRMYMRSRLRPRSAVSLAMALAPIVR